MPNNEHRELPRRVVLSRWGNSLGLRLQRSVIEEAGLQGGDRLDVAVEGGRIVLSPVRPQYRLEDLLGKITPENVHDEIDWAVRRGKEAW